MTLKRLLDEPEGGFASALLRSAALDVPSSAQVRRGVVVLSAAGSALVTSGAAGAASSAAAAAGVAPTGLSALGALGLAKWVGIGLAAGFVTAGSGAYMATESGGIQKSPEKTPASVSAIAARVTGTNLDERQAHQSGATAEHRVREFPPRSSGGLDPHKPRGDEALRATATAPSSRPTSSATVEPRPGGAAVRGSVTSYPNAAPASASAVPARTLAPASSESARPPTMSAELAALARARTALAARAPAVVLAELETYRRLSRTHVLDAEAFVLRIEALLQLGRIAEAARLAKRYLKANPASPHRVRLAQVAKLGDR